MAGIPARTAGVCLEVFTALFPILAFYILFHFSFENVLTGSENLVGMLYSYIVDLTLFLTGVNVGFMPAGKLSGKRPTSLPAYSGFLVPVAML